MQSLVERNRRVPISPLQLEALFFRFLKQLDDGSSPGALSRFLFSCESKCASKSFAGLLEHFSTRITDNTLLTYSNHSYIQFAVNCCEFATKQQMFKKIFEADCNNKNCTIRKPNHLAEHYCPAQLLK